MAVPGCPLPVEQKGQLGVMAMKLAEQQLSPAIPRWLGGKQLEARGGPVGHRQSTGCFGDGGGLEQVCAQINNTHI